MKKKVIIKYIIFTLGLLVISLGARIFLLADIGTAGIDATGVGLSEKFGLTSGVWIFIVEVVLVALSSYFRKSKINVKPLLSSFIFALSFDLWGKIVFNHLRSPDRVQTQLIVFTIGLLVETLGTSFYLLSDITVTALDYFMLSVEKRFKKSLGASRVLTELLLLITALLVGGPISIGTFLIMAFYGPILQLFHDQLKPFFKFLSE